MKNQYLRLHSFLFIAGLFLMFSIGPAGPTVLAQKRPVDPATRAAELFDQGQSEHEKNEFEKAVSLYTEALKIDPDFWQAEYQRALVCRSLRRDDEAQRGLVRTIALLADFAQAEEGRAMLRRAWQTLVEIQMRLGDLSAAEKSYQQLLSLAPSTVSGDSGGRRSEISQIRIGLAELYLRMGRVPAALEMIEQVRAAGENSPEVLGLYGAALVLAGRAEEGLPPLNESLRLDPENLVARRQRAELLITRRDYVGAIADLREVQRLVPDQSTLQRLAWALAQNRQSAEALQLYRQILSADPTNSEAKIAVAALTIEAGEGEEAIAQLEALIRTEPGRADLRAQLAEILLRKQPERALEQYLAAARIEPGQVSHRIGVGTVLVRLRRMAEAVGVLRTALSMNPSPALAYYAHTNLGTALFEQNDFTAAIPEFLWILEHQTDEKRIPITLYFLGICYDRIGEYEEARKVYEQFLVRATEVNQLEIDKVRLRLPILQKQIRDGKGKRKK